MNNEGLNEMYEAFQKQLQAYIEQRWTITEEVSETGSLFTRARFKGHPLEVLNCKYGQFELDMN